MRFTKMEQRQICLFFTQLLDPPPIYSGSLLAKALKNGAELKSGKKILLPMALSTMPQLFLINSNVWGQKSDIEIAGSCSLRTHPKIKSEPDDGIEDIPKQHFSSPAEKYNVISSDTPLPEFSSFVREFLEGGDIKPAWGSFIDECAQYYFQKFPNIQNSSEYQTIGRKMYQQYPSIYSEGKEPWSFFCKSLSQKIRHKKWKIRRKSLGITTRTVRQFRRKSFVKRSLKRKVDRRYTPSKLYKALLRELSDGWTNESISESRILDILKTTSKGRRTWLASHFHRKMFSLIEEYPCFSDGKYVLQDLLLLVNKENCFDMLQQLDSLLSAAGSFMEPPVENSSFLEKIQIMKFMEQEITYNRGRGDLTKSIIVHKQGIPEHEILQHAQSNENSSPLLFVFSEGDILQKALIAGDKTIIDTNTTDLNEAILMLIATYYTFSIDYPKAFAQIFWLLQHFVVGESCEDAQSSKCIAFMKKLTSNIEFTE